MPGTAPADLCKAGEESQPGSRKRAEEEARFELDIAINISGGNGMYLKKTWIYGNRREVRKYNTFRCGVAGEKRTKRKKPTPEQMRKANERESVKKLTRLMIGNFEQGDWHMVLTYRRDNLVTVEESKKVLKSFFDRIRVWFRKQGKELKYIIVTEWEKKRIHHHLVINDIPGLGSAVQKFWECGGVHCTPLYQDHNYQGLAEYFVKETSKTFNREENPYKRRWSSSRNLKKPVEKVEKSTAAKWRENPVVPPSLVREGYVLDKNSVYSGLDAFGYPFQEYIFIRLDRGKNDRTRKRC